MFKNFAVFDILPGWDPNLEVLESGANAFAFTPCEPTQPNSIGFVAPRGDKHGLMVENIGGQWILEVMLEKRMLPGKVVKRYLEERLDQIFEQTGRKPGKKERASIKEDLILELLPKVLTKQDSVRIWINPRHMTLCVDAGSKSKVDEVITLLVKAQENFAAVRCATAASPATSMGEWLKEDGAPEAFTVDDECELRTPDETKSAVRYSRHNLDLEEIRQHLAHGKLPTRIALTWRSRVSFVLDDQMTIKKLSMLEVVVVERQQAEDDDPFDANVAIVTGELMKLIPDLIDALGGRSQSDGSGETGAARSESDSLMAEGIGA